MNACDRAEQVALYVGGDLAPHESVVIQRHTAECADCRTLLADLMVDAALLRAPVTVPEPAYAEVRLAVHKRLRPRSRKYAGWSAATAAAAALTAATWYHGELDRPLERLQIGVTAPSAPEVSPIPQRAATARKRADPTRLAMALRAMLPPSNAAPAATTTPVLITTKTEDPNVIIILIPETRGDTHE